MAPFLIPPPFLTFPLLALALLLLSLRLLALLPHHRPPPRPRRRGAPTRLLVVLGSGGHTAEMLAMLRDLDPSAYNHRSYVVSSGDAFSADKAVEFEERLAGRWGGGGRRVDTVDGDAKGDGEALGEGRWDGDMRGGKEEQEEEEKREGEGEGIGTYDITFVPRARRIHQSLLTTPISALQCLWVCLRVLRSPPHHHSHSKHSAHPPHPAYPDLILTNGPGTAVIVILASLILRFFDVGGANSSGSMRTVYVESWARVKRLSLSGRLLVRVVDRFLVQWEGLEGVGGRGEFLGVLV